MSTYSFAVPLQTYNILELFNTQTLLPEKTTVLGWVELADLELQVSGSLQLGSWQPDAFNGEAVHSRQIGIDININLLGATFSYASSGKYYFDSNSLLIAGLVDDRLTVYDFFDCTLVDLFDSDSPIVVAEYREHTLPPNVDLAATFDLEAFTLMSTGNVKTNAQEDSVSGYRWNVTFNFDSSTPLLPFELPTEWIGDSQATVRLELAATDGDQNVSDTFGLTIKSLGSGYDLAPKFKYWNKGAGSERLLSDVRVEVGEIFDLSDNTGTSLLEGVDDLDDTDDGTITPVITYPKVANKNDASINLSDVIASLKLFLGLNLPEAYRSPYNYVAADLDANGKVELSDVISLLKVFLGLPVANTQAMEWVFVKDSVSPTDVNGQPFDKDHATPPPVTHDFSESAEVNIVGILRGDVDGSWTVA
jgi:hypothetical protein